MSENRYEITKLLGKGRTGGVYEAEDGNLNRKVAMRRFFDQGNRVDFTQHKEEFIQVAQSLSSLQHPNLLRIFDAGFDEDGAYIVSQLLEGESLHKETKKGKIEINEVIELAKQMLDAFSMAHDIGYFHGALTPDSIFMVPRARGGYTYIILDMGLSRLAPIIQGEGSVLAVMADSAILSPELFDGGVADARADLYMLGQILFMCIAGGHPFGGLSVEEAKKKHLKGLSSIKKYNSDVSKSMAEWLGTLTAVKPEDRPASAVEALRTLQQISSSAYETSSQRILSGMEPVPETSRITITDEGEEPTINSKITGPVPILPPGITQDDIPVTIPWIPKKNKPVIGIAIGAAALVVIVVGIILMMGDKEQDDMHSDTSTKSIKPEQLNLDKNTSSSSVDDSNIKDIRENKFEGLVLTDSSEKLGHFVGKKPDFNTWESRCPSLQSADNSGAGWLINDNDVNLFTGVRFPLREQTNKMFDEGWHITYKVKVISGTHRIGFLLSGNMNPGWMDNDSIGCCVIVKRIGNQITFYSPADASYSENKNKSHVRDLIVGEDEILTLTIEQAPEATSGEYVVKLDGEKIYTDTFSQGITYQDDRNWIDHLFCSTLDEKSTPTWMIEEITLQVF